ncbi:hypothetical protein F3087_45060 [Nocardia colli]|uniref:Uncharacterized protein n=1 Tax=Nocardia colli TaxID=2545717 RepID=A0A5N0DKY0_9NOCA|nr:hypothetical protein [Nocardia colli]KAA8877346.1 hypothetical protein F3087_45060 [Nocardia colli]
MGLEDEDDCTGGCPRMACHDRGLYLTTTLALWRVFRAHEQHPSCCIQRTLSSKELARLGLIDLDIIAVTRTHQLAPKLLEWDAASLRKPNPVKMRRRHGHVPEYVVSPRFEPNSPLTPEQFLTPIRQRFPYVQCGRSRDVGDPMPTQAMIIDPPLRLLGVSLSTNGFDAYLDPADDCNAAFFAIWYARTIPFGGHSLSLVHTDTDTAIALTPSKTPFTVIAELSFARDHAREATIYRRP